MKTKLRSTIVAGAVAIALMAGGAGSAVAAGSNYAEPPSGIVAADGNATTQVTSLSGEQIKEADKYVTRNGDVYQFNKKEASKSLDPAVVDEVDDAVSV